jgi:hypothetical protein
MLGASGFLAYDIMLHRFRHHDEATTRPKYLDHTAATFVISLAVAATVFKHPMHVFNCGFFSLTLVSPVTWWLRTEGKLNSVRNANIFYENSCTKEEIERFRHQDMIEDLGSVMLTQKGYGYVHLHDE